MNDDRDWAELRPNTGAGVGGAGLGMLRVTLLFGSLAVALALFVAPFLDRGTGSDLTAYNPGIDRTATATVFSSNQYTVRRSVLQSSPNSRCIIYSNGARSGDC